MWDALSQMDNVLTVSYEDCHADLHRTIQDIVFFYEFHVDDNKVQKAIEASRIDNMRSIEESGLFPENWLRKRNGAPKVREGQVGSSRRYLVSEDLRYLHEVFERRLSG
jgi:hypothetical protein